MVAGSLFSNDYQGGVSFEVFSTHGSNPVANWKLAGPKPAKKVFEKSVKSYVYNCDGGPANKMQLPKDDIKSLTLLQPFLVFQIFLPPGQHFSLEISVSDTEGTRRRFNFSTNFTESKRTPLHCQVPLVSVRHGIWQNLVLHMVDLVENYFRGHTFQSVDHLVLMPVFKLRKVFTLRALPLSLGGPDPIPKQCDFNPGTECITTLFSPHEETQEEGLSLPLCMGREDASASELSSIPQSVASSGDYTSVIPPLANKRGGHSSASDRSGVVPSTLAFGSKIALSKTAQKVQDREAGEAGGERGGFRKAGTAPSSSGPGSGKRAVGKVGLPRDGAGGGDDSYRNANSSNTPQEVPTNASSESLYVNATGYVAPAEGRVAPPISPGTKTSKSSSRRPLTFHDSALNKSSDSPSASSRPPKDSSSHSQELPSPSPADPPSSSSMLFSPSKRNHSKRSNSNSNSNSSSSTRLPSLSAGGGGRVAGPPPPLHSAPPTLPPSNSNSTHPNSNVLENSTASFHSTSSTSTSASHGLSSSNRRHHSAGPNCPSVSNGTRQVTLVKLSSAQAPPTDASPPSSDSAKFLSKGRSPPSPGIFPASGSAGTTSGTASGMGLPGSGGTSLNGSNPLGLGSASTRRYGDSRTREPLATVSNPSEDRGANEEDRQGGVGPAGTSGGDMADAGGVKHQKSPHKDGVRLKRRTSKKSSVFDRSSASVSSVQEENRGSKNQETPSGSVEDIPLSKHLLRSGGSVAAGGSHTGALGGSGAFGKDASVSGSVAKNGSRRTLLYCSEDDMSPCKADETSGEESSPTRLGGVPSPLRQDRNPELEEHPASRGILRSTSSSAFTDHISGSPPQPLPLPHIQPQPQTQPQPPQASQQQQQQQQHYTFTSNPRALLSGSSSLHRRASIEEPTSPRYSGNSMEGADMLRESIDASALSGSMEHWREEDPTTNQAEAHTHSVGGGAGRSGEEEARVEGFPSSPRISKSNSKSRLRRGGGDSSSNLYPGESESGEGQRSTVHDSGPLLASPSRSPLRQPSWAAPPTQLASASMCSTSVAESVAESAMSFAGGDSPARFGALGEEEEAEIAERMQEAATRLGFGLSTVSCMDAEDRTALSSKPPSHPNSSRDLSRDLTTLRGAQDQQSAPGGREDKDKERERDGGRNRSFSTDMQQSAEMPDGTSRKQRSPSSDSIGQGLRSGGLDSSPSGPAASSTSQQRPSTPPQPSSSSSSSALLNPPHTFSPTHHVSHRQERRAPQGSNQSDPESTTPPQQTKTAEYSAPHSRMWSPQAALSQAPLRPKVDKTDKDLASTGLFQDMTSSIADLHFQRAEMFTPPVIPASKVAALGLNHDTIHANPPVAISGERSVFESQEEELDLMYDPILNFYYDPKTNKYYELL